ncbi:MAG: DALR anticodon-binding domain-containing protein, partial [Rhodobacteraceae bacterium]|nr:DALR anticodon-binding domain-containing protein [Paracoccaceae bacterium]
LKMADLSLLIHPAQIALARRVSEWPRIVDQASRHHEPHRIAFYLNELASDLHSYWTLGNREKQLRLIQEEDAEGTKARLTLVRAVAVVISTGLGILGVKPMTEMRD